MGHQKTWEEFASKPHQRLDADPEDPTADVPDDDGVCIGDFEKEPTGKTARCPVCSQIASDEPGKGWVIVGVGSPFDPRAR